MGDAITHISVTAKLSTEQKGQHNYMNYCSPTGHEDERKYA